MQEELLRKILERLESIDENLEKISNKLNKPLQVVTQENTIQKSLEKSHSVVFTTKQE